MRRLILRRGRERGAVAVVVALLIVVLMAFAAVAVDLAGIYSEKQQLQNGADAAALAIAEDCAYGRAACASYNTTAGKYATSNKLDGMVDSVAVTKTAGSSTTSASVTVVPSYRRTNWFAGMVGIPSTTVSATATANWGYPSGGSALPLTFSKDCFEDATGGWNGEGVPTLSVEITINIKEKNPACSWPAHNGTPGNFGWLEAIDCKAKVAAGGWVYSDVGNNGPSSTCDPADWIALQKKSIMVPIFDDTNDLNGTKAMFHIVGIAAFKVTGYCLDSKSEYNVTQCPSNPRLVGKFTSYTDVTGDFSIAADAPHFGALTVELSA